MIEQLYKPLYLIRRTEEEITKVYPTDKIKSPVHLSIGQEAISVGVCTALRPDDIVFGTYRGHAMYLAKGGDLKKMIAELYGKVTGCAKGRGGSMHLTDKKAGVMGTSAIVGTTIPISVGYALGIKYKKSDLVVVSFFGDGAVDEGAFHESMNFAATKRLPVLFICENNSYAIHSHYLKRHHSDNIWKRAKSYGMQAERIEDGDIFKIFEFTQKAVDQLRNDNGPIFLECITARWKEHVGPCDDFHLGYRDEKEIRWWVENDQLKKLRSLLKENRALAIELEVEQEIEDAFKYAENSQFPTQDELYTYLFKD